MGPRKKLAILKRRKDVAARYLRGQAQWEIALAFEVDQKTVCNDLKAIRADWRQHCNRDFDEHVAEELAKIDALEVQAWEGWRRSQEATETLRARRRNGSEESEKMVRGQGGQAGDPRFLDLVLKCVNKRCELLGLDKQTGIVEAPFKVFIGITTEEIISAPCPPPLPPLLPGPPQPPPEVIDQPPTT